MQRIRVGVTGLAAVLALILIASALFRLASNEAPVTAVGAPNANVVADMTGTANAVDATDPLAELGVAPPPIGGNDATPAGR